MREEAVGTFHPLHCLVVSTVLISEYSEPEGKRIYYFPLHHPPPLFCGQSMREWMMDL